MEKKPITVTEFMKKYNTLSSEELKENMVRALVYRTYVPILEKKICLQKMFDRSLMGESGNQYVDMFMNKIGTTIAIIQMYTNLTFVKQEDSDTNMFDDYDILAENDMLNGIFKYIPESELTAILSTNEQIMQTFYNEYQSPKAYVTSLVDRFSSVVGAMTDSSSKALLEVLNDDEKMNGIINKLPKPDKILNMVKGIVNGKE